MNIFETIDYEAEADPLNPCLDNIFYCFKKKSYSMVLC